MASLFGNHNRVKLVDEDEDHQRSTTRLGSLLKPNRMRLLDARLCKDDSVTSFENDSLFSSADGSGEADSLAPQARPLHHPASSSATVDSSLDSLRPLASIKEPESSSHRSRKPPLPLGGSAQSPTSLFADFDKGERTPHSKWQQEESAVSLFDPDTSRASFFRDDHNSSRTSFFQEDHNASRTSFFQEEEDEEIEGSGRPNTKVTPDGFPASRSITKDLDFRIFEPEEEEADDLISPVPESPFSKPKVGFARKGVENFLVPSTPSDRSTSRRSLPSSLARSHSMIERSPTSKGTSRSLRGSRRTALRATVSDSAKSSTAKQSTDAIDYSKVGDVAREKSHSLRAHRSTMQSASIRRSANRNNSIKDRRTIDGVLNNILGDYDDTFDISPTTPNGSRRSCRSSIRRTQTSSKKQVDKDMGADGATGELLLNDVDFPEPYFSPTSSKKKVNIGEEKERSGRSIRTTDRKERSTRSTRTTDVDDKERSSRGSRRGSTRRGSRSLDKHIEDPSESNSEIVTPATPDSTVKESVGGKSRSSRGRSTSDATNGKSRKSTFPDSSDFALVSPTKAKSSSVDEDVEATENKRSLRKSRTSVRHQNSPTTDSESKKLPDKFDSGFGDFALGDSKTPQELGFETSFGSFKTENSSMTSPKKIAAQSSVRERPTVEPKITRARMAPIIPKRLREAKSNKEESLDTSGHTNYTKATNWNWEDDNWGGQTVAIQPTTIQEDDDDEDNAFGSPTIHSRKGLDSSLQGSSSFMSPVVHETKALSSKSSELGDFFEIGNSSNAAGWIEPSDMTRSVASAPLNEPFASSSLSRELHRTNSVGRRPHRRSDPGAQSFSTTNDISLRQQRGSASKLPSPRAVEAVFGANSSSFGSRPSTSARRGSHQQRKGAVRDSMCDFLETENAAAADPEDSFFS